MSWAGMSGGLLVLLEKLWTQNPQLPLARLRDRLVVRPLAHGAARDAEQVRELTISHAQPLSELCFRHVHGDSLPRLATVSSPLSATVRREVLRALDSGCLGG